MRLEKKPDADEMRKRLFSETLQVFALRSAANCPPPQVALSPTVLSVPPPHTHVRTITHIRYTHPHNHTHQTQREAVVRIALETHSLSSLGCAQTTAVTQAPSSGSKSVVLLFAHALSHIKHQSHRHSHREKDGKAQSKESKAEQKHRHIRKQKTKKKKKKVKKKKKKKKKKNLSLPLPSSSSSSSSSSSVCHSLSSSCPLLCVFCLSSCSLLCVSCSTWPGLRSRDAPLLFSGVIFTRKEGWDIPAVKALLPNLTAGSQDHRVLSDVMQHADKNGWLAS